MTGLRFAPFGFAILLLGACAAPGAQGVATDSPTPGPLAPGADPAPPEAPLPPLVFPDDPFRAELPKGGPPRPLKTPELQRFKLENGISVFLVERHNLPIVSMSLVFDGGGTVDPKGKEGLASVCAGLMSQGTEKLDKIAFEEAMADVASDVSSGASDDQHWVSFNSLSKNLEPTMGLWTDTLLRPGMRQDELDRNLKRRVAGLKQMKGDAAAVAGRLANSVVYGPLHPVGRFATETSYGSIDLAACKKFVADYVRPQGARLFAVGDISKAELVREVEKRLGGWSGRAKRAPTLGRARPRKGKVFFVDIPNAQQSVVTMMHIGPPRKAPDYHATSLMSAILGGGFSSRLNMNLREKHGYTYGARGGFDYTRQDSVFRANASVRADATKESIAEMLKEIRGLRQGAPTPEELSREKNGSILALPSQFATGGQTLGAFRMLVYYGLPLDYFDTYTTKVQGVSLNAVDKAADKHLKPEDLQILVVGDRQQVLPKLDELAKEKVIPAVKPVELDPDGNVVGG